MKIGNNDYTPPFWWDYTDEGWFIADSFGSKEPDDGEGDQVEVDDILSALNELAELRQRVKEIPLAECLIADCKQLRAERDALKARVEELENTIDCGCNALTDSICCSGNDADTNLGFVRKMKRVLIGNNPTTPGGDE